MFTYDYTAQNITNAKRFGITSLRLGFNVDTALDETEVEQPRVDHFREEQADSDVTVAPYPRAQKCCIR